MPSSMAGGDGERHPRKRLPILARDLRDRRRTSGPTHRRRPLPARKGAGRRRPPILKLTTHPSRSPLRQAEVVVHTANSLTSTDWYVNSPRVEQEQGPSSNERVGEHVRKVVSEASLPKTPSRKGWYRERGLGKVRVEKAKTGQGVTDGDVARVLL
eukprot:scaffold13511_cov132-Isochrysis_galbana.AAC.4